MSLIVAGTTGHCDDVSPFARASATCAFNLIQYSERSLCSGFHAARARLRQYSAAHSSSGLVPSRIAASTRANSLALRTCCVFLQTQGDFPQPIHNPFSSRALIFFPAGLLAIKLPRLQSLSLEQNGHARKTVVNKQCHSQLSTSKKHVWIANRVSDTFSVCAAFPIKTGGGRAT
jgi:hypothetical protein